MGNEFSDKQIAIGLSLNPENTADAVKLIKLIDLQTSGYQMKDRQASHADVSKFNEFRDIDFEDNLHQTVQYFGKEADELVHDIDLDVN
jgi:hypothetical protein